MNTGHSPVISVMATDDKVGPITFTQSALAVGATATGTGSYTVTQADLDAGSVTNNVVVTATDLCGKTISASTALTVMIGCAAGEALCGGQCIDITSDPLNCGSCGNVCGASHVDVPGCSNGVCTISLCEVPFADCNGVFADGCEVNLWTDTANCGSCDNYCTPNMACNGFGFCEPIG